MNRHSIGISLTLIIFMQTALMACPQSPYVYISDWYHVVSVGATVELEAEDSSGTYVTDWSWSYSGATKTYQYDDLGTNGSSEAGFTFSSTGVYDIYATATNNYNLTDYDYARVIVVDVGLSGGGYIGVNDDDDNGNQVSDKDDTGPVSGENNLDALSLSVTPTGYSGELWLRALSGGSKIKVWYQSDKGGESVQEVTLPHMWLPYRYIPSTLYIEGISPSSSEDDVELQWSYEYDGEVVASDTEEYTVMAVQVGITASDLSGSVSDADELDPGAFLHFNLDNDNGSSDSLGSPEHPGGDYLEITNTVNNENDLKALTMSLNPEPNEGYIELSIPSDAKIWRNAIKGSLNLVLASGSKTWNLSNASEKSDFLSLCSSLYVEGVDTGMGNVVLKYKNPNSTEIDSDTIKYTFIAADCGDQPTVDLEDIYAWGHGWTLYHNFSQRQNLEGIFPNLEPCEYSVTVNLGTYNGATYTLPLYNCIAWSVNETDIWYNVSDIYDYIESAYPEFIRAQAWDGDPEPFTDSDSDGKYDPAEEYTDQNSNGQYDLGEWYEDRNGNSQYDEAEPFDDVEVVDGKYTWSFIDLFYELKKGWTLIESGSDEEKANQAEAMYFSGYHAARKRSCSCSSGEWIMFESKCGQWEQIEHVWNHLNGSAYGYPGRFYE